MLSLLAVVVYERLRDDQQGVQLFCVFMVGCAGVALYVHSALVMKIHCGAGE